MRERPILFSGEMVRAILDGRKTQTRRVCKFQDFTEFGDYAPGVIWHGKGKPGWLACPYGRPGDSLWVRESFYTQPELDLPLSQPQPIAYAADGHIASLEDYTGRPSIHMPRWASRLTLEVTAVRVERLQAISEADARAEGVAKLYRTPRWLDGEARRQFETLWDGINGKRAAWASDPWVWCVSFKVAT